jgi:hypothetical protein
MPRIRPSHAATRAPRRRATRMRRTAFVGAALASLLGLMACVVQVQAQDRGHRRWSIGRAAFHGDQRRAAHRPAPSTTVTTPPRTSPAPSDPPATTAPPATPPPASTPPASPPPSSSVPSSCAPIRITAGGTYTGCYTSTSTGTPAVTLATNQPVRLDHARVIAKGYGVQDTVSGTRLTVVDSTFEQRDPGAVVAHRAIELEQPASLVAEHNRFSDGDGIWIGGGTVDPLAVRSNLATNIGRYPHPTSGNCCVQCLQLDSVRAPSGEIAWNHVQNTSGQSGVEDNINLFQSGGTDSAHRVQIDHNLVDGAYPRSASDTGFTGGGILGSDGSGSFGHTVVHDNTVVSTTNYGVGAAGGTDLHLVNNLMVNDTLGSDGSSHYFSEFGQAISAHDITASDASGNRQNWRRDASGDHFACWTGALCASVATVATTEQQARDAWAASVPASATPIGPRA